MRLCCIFIHARGASRALYRAWDTEANEGEAQG